MKIENIEIVQKLSSELSTAKGNLDKLDKLLPIYDESLIKEECIDFLKKYITKIETEIKDFGVSL